MTPFPPPPLPPEDDRPRSAGDEHITSNPPPPLPPLPSEKPVRRRRPTAGWPQPIGTAAFIVIVLVVLGCGGLMTLVATTCGDLGGGSGGVTTKMLPAAPTI